MMTQEVKTENNEVKGQDVVTPAPEKINAYPEEVIEVKERKTIIPKVVLPLTVDEEIEAVLQEEEDEQDLNQHFFIDQVHWKRPSWGSGWWFGRCAMIALAVDMSALQSFPKNVANNGGIIYVLVYFVCLVVFGYPGVILEGIVGQHFQTGLLGIWGLCPVLRGIGVAVFSSTLVATAFAPCNVMWSTIMMFDSFKALSTENVPWATCDNLWNTCRCKGIRRTDCPPHNETENTPAFEYYLGKVLQIWKTQYGNPKEIHDFTQNGNWSVSYGFHNPQDGLGELLVVPGLIVLSIFAIILLLVSIDTKYSGYFYTFTSLFPLLTLTILFCRGITLQGAAKGVRKYLAPDFSKVLSAKTWILAIESTLYTLTLGEGIYVSIGSCNPLHHNILADAMTVVVADTLTSLLSCVVVYAFMGHLYNYENEELPETFSAIDVAFVEMPNGLAVITGSAFFAVLYFLMVTMITSDTIIVTLQFLTYSLYEEYKRKYPDQTASSRLFSMPVIGFAFGCALLCVTRGGYWMYLFLGNFYNGFNLIFVILLQEFAFSYIFGLEDISIVFETITGGRPGLYLRTCWKYIRPTLTLIIFLDECISRNIQSYHITAFDSGLDAPPELEYFGAACDFVYFFFVISYMIYEFSKVMKSKAKSCRQRAMFLISPEYDRARILVEPDHAKRGHLKHWLYFSDPMDPSIKDQLKQTFISMVDAIKKITSKLKRKSRKTSMGLTKMDRLSKSISKSTIKSEQDESAWEILDKAKQLQRQSSLEMATAENTEQAGTSQSPKSNTVQGKKRQGKSIAQVNTRNSIMKKSNLGAKPYV